MKASTGCLETKYIYIKDTKSIGIKWRNQEYGIKKRKNIARFVIALSQSKQSNVQYVEGRATGRTGKCLL